MLGTLERVREAWLKKTAAVGLSDPVKHGRKLSYLDCDASSLNCRQYIMGTICAVKRTSVRRLASSYMLVCSLKIKCLSYSKHSRPRHIKRLFRLTSDYRFADLERERLTGFRDTGAPSEKLRGSFLCGCGEIHITKMLPF